MGIEPMITGPQPAVLPLHHSHHVLNVITLHLLTASAVMIKNPTRSAENITKFFSFGKSSIRQHKRRRYLLRRHVLVALNAMVSPGRFERPTCCLEGSCSIQLSYEDVRCNATMYDNLTNLSSFDPSFQRLDLIGDATLCRFNPLDRSHRHSGGD